MRFEADVLKEFFAQHADVVQVTLSKVQGSSPRNAGTQMFVSKEAICGTIGGGQLEFMVIDHARQLLRSSCLVVHTNDTASDRASVGASDTLSDTMDVPLGPSIGQCCGGRVGVSLRQMNAADKREAIQNAQETDALLPHVYVLGAGHVGLALAEQFQHLPVRCILIDTRPEALAQCSADVETRLRVLPESDVKHAPAGSAFIVLTHDHALDFLITSSALARGDAAYVGMIGSGTKRATFASWCRNECANADLDPLVCPIGAQGSDDKRPAVIAAFVVAEVLCDLTRTPPLLAQTSRQTSRQAQTHSQA